MTGSVGMLRQSRPMVDFLFRSLGMTPNIGQVPISVNSDRVERLGGGARELAELMVDSWALGRD